MELEKWLSSESLGSVALLATGIVLASGEVSNLWGVHVGKLVAVLTALAALLFTGVTWVALNGKQFMQKVTVCFVAFFISWTTLFQATRGMGHTIQKQAEVSTETFRESGVGTMLFKQVAVPEFNPVKELRNGQWHVLVRQGNGQEVFLPIVERGGRNYAF